MYKTIHTLEEYNEIVGVESALLIYFSTDQCSVCKVLKPKVGEMITESFPAIRLVYVNLNHLPEIAAQNRIFAVPTIQVLFDGREYIRKSRNFGLDQLKSEIDRPYRMMFS